MTQVSCGANRYTDHEYQRFDDCTLFCPKCGDTKKVDGCVRHVCSPCPWPHYNWPPQIYPTLPTIWCGTNTAGTNGPFTVVN